MTITFLDDTVYLGLLAAALIFTVWTFFSISDFGDVSSSFPEDSVSDKVLAKTVSDMSRFFTLFRFVIFDMFAAAFWMSLGIYTLSSSYTFQQPLGIFYFILGVVMVGVFILYLVIFSAAFLKNRIADFRP